MKKSIHLTEHLLIPLALALLNIAIVHLIYLLAHRDLATPGQTIPVALSLALLAGGIAAKRNWLLAGGGVVYLVVLGAGLIF